MKRFYSVLQKITAALCGIIISWFAVYFLRGEEFSLTFSDRVFASYFPQILVFATGVSIYLLFIFQIKSNLKWWKKLLILLIGFLFATIPFLLYHGHFQYQEHSFWNREISKSKNLYFNKSHSSETIKIIESKSQIDTLKIEIDTIHSKQITPYFELQNPVKIVKSEKANWELGK
ncbi:hypothetical protein [Moheibacter sediminis]|uniref:Uncharacterized protein n=1 Tax=Moheibacter sediminis TaxID=1434700 RepID=A0A1W1Y8R3_9FLAO|nr:hypothetical protein [Moheibacter sediminis]SMC32547.1 hypothetical protein SAMN06296427_10192 [Moheibacter sediminis]